MKRRDFITFLGDAAALANYSAPGSQPTRSKQRPSRAISGLGTYILMAISLGSSVNN
jgi:hypothetical protein